MSAYRVISCQVKDEVQVLAGLEAIGIPSSEIEIHQQAVNLYNYQGKNSGQKGNIIVRRENFKKYTNSHWNADLGFEKTRGDGYQTHINSEEARWWQTNEPRFLQAAAEEKVKQEARKRGYHVSTIQTSENGNLKLQLVRHF